MSIPGETRTQRKNKSVSICYLGDNDQCKFLSYV